MTSAAMSTPAKRKAQSPAPGTPAPTVVKAKSPTPGPASPGPSPNVPASPAPGTPAPVADESALPTGMLTGAHWVQVGLPEDDTDSTLGSDVESSTASISSSILNYRTINGRTYHSDSVTSGEYWGPNDAKHIETLEVFSHAADLMLEGKLYLAPIEKGIKHAIDIGTGSGVWAIDFADEFPECEVIGTDISPVQPTWCPPNLRFEIDDAIKEWTFKPDYFDYIHIRFLNGAIPDWDALYEQTYRVCKPGGWIEHVDITATMGCDDGTVVAGSALEQYGKLFGEAGRRLGLTQSVSENNLQENGLKKAGFVNLTVKEFKMPVSSWPQDPKQKDVGLYAYAAVSSDIEGIIQFAFGQILGWSQEEMTVYTAHLRQELKDTSIHAYYKWKLVYAQKPE